MSYPCLINNCIKIYMHRQFWLHVIPNCKIVTNVLCFPYFTHKILKLVKDKEMLHLTISNIIVMLDRETILNCKRRCLCILLNSKVYYYLYVVPEMCRQGTNNMRPCCFRHINFFSVVPSLLENYYIVAGKTSAILFS